MPLRDHFRPPLDDIRAWESFHAQWPAMIVLALSRRLPRRYIAAPSVHAGPFVEIDVGTLDEEDANSAAQNGGNGEGGVATAVWVPARPTLTFRTDLPAQDEYEVRIFDARRGHRLVAAVEIVSPANKDRPEHRRAFVAKCAALLQKQVSVTIIDLVTSRNFNLYRDLLEFIGRSDASSEPEQSALYAAACRGTKKGESWQMETWAQVLLLGQTLPTLPLWLADDFAVPLELEECYEETCRVLRIP